MTPFSASTSATRLLRMKSSIRGVAPALLIITATSLPAKSKSARICAKSISTISSAVLSGSRWVPGSPWMPMPTSISSSPSSKPGLPAAGTVQGAMAAPMVRTLSMTFWATA